MARDTRSRKHQITINNPAEHGYSHEVIRVLIQGIQGVIYWCMGDEIGDNGTYHTCVFIQTQNQVRFSTMKKKFPDGHIEQCKGSARQNRAYILKEGEKHAEKAHTTVEGTFAEGGELPEEEKPGQRMDLVRLRGMIEEGRSNIEIMTEDPRYTMRLDQIERLRQHLLHEVYRTKIRDVETEYHYGVTRTGKTSSVLNRFGMINCYRVTDYSHPWDFYAGQPILVLDEFHGQILMTDMLNICDQYPMQLRARYGNKWACWERVIIISNISLVEQYPNIQRESPRTWEAFEARIAVQRYYGLDLKIVQGGKSDCPF